MRCSRCHVLVLLGLICGSGGLPVFSGQSAIPSPLVRVGVDKGGSACRLSGGIQRLEDGTLSFTAQPAAGEWGWVTVSKDGQPLRQLEGLESFTICGWLAPNSLQTGSGGNRIAFNLNYNRSGFDLVHLDDGRLRLAVNEWPDGVRNDSSSGKLKPGQWTFFAVSYDGASKRDNVRWYFGGPDSAASLDRKMSYSAGPTGSDSGPLTIGNYNQTIHRHGTDRQFRGYLHGIQIFGSRRGTDGALDRETIRQLQVDAATQPNFGIRPEKARSTPPLHSTIQTDPAEPGVNVPSPASGTRPRIIATTDGEIDDRCSMVRFLLYANEWDIEGIVHSSSKFHWKGDGQDIRRHNWADEVWLDRQIDLYEQVYPKLSRHADRFPTADALRKLVYTGNVANVGHMSQDTPGSDRIVEVLLDDEPGPVYLQAWGGTNTIARALWKIQHEHPDRMAEVSRRAILFLILDQDTTFREYIQPNWPDLLTLGSFSQFATIAYRWDRMIPEELHEYFDRAWMERNILGGHGPLCAIYEAHPQKGFRSEGDSPAFMHQIDVGLRSLEHPGYGSWGGRFTREKPGSAVWKGARDGGDPPSVLYRGDGIGQGRGSGVQAVRRE
ncbi:MAG: DUF1593 domain-containing protein [Planctomycetes bacterium]|nr:DUF1593 domain-containing protein [Planctomycetota bacterium]